MVETEAIYYHYRFIGAIYGRMIGLAMVKLFGVKLDHPVWSWIDPGAMALIGASSFFGGVSRLTMSLTVIMVSPGYIRSSSKSSSRQGSLYWFTLACYVLLLLLA